MSADSSSSKIKENTDSTTYFYAIRKCDTLERPAIFSSWKDCAVHVNGENCGLEYKRFETSVEASNYAFQEEKQSATNPERLKGASDDDEGDVAISKNRTVGKSTASKSSTDTASNGNGINNLGAIANPSPNFANPLINNSFLVGGLVPIGPMANTAANYMAAFPPIQPRPMNTTNGSPGSRPNPGAISVIMAADAEQPPKKKYKSTKYNENWEIKFKELLDYKKKYGNFDVKTGEHEKLRKWLIKQRLMIRSHQESDNGDPTTAYRVKRLLDSGLSGDKIRPRKSDKTPDVMLETKWADNIAMLVKHKEKYGTCDVKAASTINMNYSEKVKHEKFHYWVRRTSEQLHLYETDPESSTYLNADRVKQLNDIGFVKIEVKHREIIKRTWEENFERLKAFKEENGHTNVPCLPRSSLRNWICLQRSMYERLKAGKKSELNGERVASLMKLGFELVSKRKQKTFDERALEWFEFKTKHGHVKDKTLSWWTKEMRKKKRALDEGRETNLTQEQVDKLTAWGFKWDTGFIKPTVVTAPKSWDERFADLCQYKEENGHVNVPQLHPILGNWVNAQRKDYRNRKLGESNAMTDEKIKKLTEVGFVWLTRKSGGSDKKKTLKKIGSAESDEHSESEEESYDSSCDEIVPSDQNYDPFSNQYGHGSNFSHARKQAGFAGNWL